MQSTWRTRQARRRATLYQVSTSQIELLETRVLLTDFGDAPLPYPTLSAENGAQHAEVGLKLGSNRDGEANGVHSTSATGDDTTGSPDDEDGVTFPATIRVGDLGVQLTVNVSGITTTGKLDAWIDFNGDGSWGGPGDQIANNVTVVNGNNTLTFAVPAWAKDGTTFARFRLSSAGNLGPEGAAADGEVEDYAVTITPPVASAGQFGSQRSVTTSANGAQSTFAADIDGDGDMDLLSASSYDDKIAWYENDGTPQNGGWTARTISTSADHAESVFALDVDGDGDVDVLSASRYDGKIAWYENDGTPAVGAWVAHTVSAASFNSTQASSVFAADVDGDGDIDVLSTAVTNAVISWYENDGNQSFTAHTIATGAVGAIEVYTADLDRDGDMDVVSASTLDDKVAWYENDGNQTFTARTIDTTGDSPTSVFIADVDGDGDMDVLSASYINDRIAWHENDGSPSDGGWTTRVITTSLNGATSVSAGDMDGDGDLDVLSASSADNRIAWYKNDGSQNFTLETISTVANSAQTVVAADVDGDGDLDVVSAAFVDDEIAWYENLNDTTPPSTTSFVRLTPSASLTNADTLVFRVTFSEDVTGVAAADFAATGTTATLSVASVSASVYDVTLTGGNLATLNGTVGLNFAASPTITDLLGNALPSTEPATDETFTIDNTAPSTTSFVRQTPSSSPTNANSLVFRVTFGEAVTGVAAADFTATGTTATLSVASVSSTVYDVTLTGGNLASLNGTVGLNFAASPTISDLAGNALPSTEPGTDETFVIDNTAPSTTSFVRQSPASSPTNVDTLVFRVTFSEDVTGVAAADFAASGTTATLSIATVSASVYDVTLTGGNLASLNGTVGLNFAASPTITDLAGNSLPSTEPVTDQTFVVDNTAPSTASFVRQTPSTSLTNADTLVFRVTFSEDVTGIAAADFAASGTTATLSVASVGPLIYDVTLTGGDLASLNGTVGLNFAASPTITDLAGNALPSTEPATDETFVVDNTAPITTSFVRQTPSTSPTNVNTLVFRVTFSEDVTGVAAADFVASGTSATLSVAAVIPSVYDVTLSGGDLASLNGTVGLNFNVPAITDLAGNSLPNSEPITDETFNIDNAAPGTTSFVRQTPSSNPTSVDTLVFRVTFDEAVTGVDVADFAASGTTAVLSVASVSALIYDVTLTGGDLANLNGTVGLNFNSPAITDPAGNALPSTEPATDETFVVNNTAPSTTSFVRQTPANSPTNANTLVFRVTFSEAVSGVDAADFAASGTTATLSITSVSASVYDVTLTGGDLETLNGTVGLNFAASPTITNLASVALPNSEPATDETYVVDNSAPDATSFVRQTPSTSPTNADSLVFRVTFNEDVAGVAAADFVASGTTAAISVASVSASVYDVTLTGGNLANLNGTVGLNFAASPTIDDLAGNAVSNAEPITDDTFDVDNTAPAVVVTPNGTITNASQITFTLQFSETVAGFDATDINVTNGTKGTFTAVDGDTYTLVVLPNADGIVSADVNANAATDAATNGNTAGTASITSDITAPGLSITPDGTLTNAASTEFTFQFTEAVTGFDASDIAVTNGTKGTFTAVDGDTYTLVVSPIGDGTVSVDVSANAASDAASNGNTSATASIISDRTAPSLDITPNGTLTNAASTTFSFQFSEVVTGFDASDITVTNGTKGIFTAVDGDTYTLVVTPNADGLVSVDVDSNAATDAANNGNTAGTASITSDVTAPGLSITPDGTLTNAASATFTFQFTGVVTGFDASDIAVTNGTQGTFTAVDGDTYTLVVTPIVDGAVTVSVSANAAIDTATNGNLAASATITSDRTAPAMTITPNVLLTNATSTTFTFQFTELVSGFAASDISLTNGTKGAFTAVDGDTYTLVVSPIGDGTVSVDVSANAASDAAANGNTSATASITSDRTAPALTITPDGILTNAAATTFTFQFTEAVTGFDANDVTLANGTQGTFTAVDGDTYILVVTPLANGIVSVNVNADVSADAASNGNTAASASITSDRTGPALTVTPNGTLTNAASTTFTFQFAGDVTGFDASDVSVTNGTKGTFTAVDGDTYTLVVTPVADGVVTVSVNANAAIDAATNGNTPATASITSDRTSPALNITPNGILTNAASTTFTFQFTEPVTGFVASDINITNGTQGAFTAIDGDTYTLVVTPIADGVVSVNVNAGIATDAAANSNMAASASMTSDRTAPALTITPNGTLTNAATTTFTFQFTSPVTGFSASDVNVMNGSKGTFTAIDSDTYTLVVTPNANGTVSASVGANAAIDAASNGNAPATGAITSDRTAPALNITPNGTLTNADAIMFTFQFSEVVTGFGASDVTLTNGTQGTFTAVDGDTYTLVVSPIADGVVSVSVNANSANDAATNGNVAASASMTSNRTAPSLTIAPDGILTNAASIVFTFQFSETVSGFDSSDINLTNGVPGIFTAVDGDTYTLVVVPVADGVVSLSVNANAATNAATNGNTSATASITSDRTIPTLTITPDGTLTNAAVTTFTFQFSEAVTGFDANDVTVTNGIQGTFTAIDGDTYTLAVTPLADGTVSLSVNAAAASDSAANGNSAATASIVADRSGPVFSSSASSSVPENSTGVLTVVAADAHGPVTFAIQGGPDVDQFAIDANSGALRFVGPPDFENPTDANLDNVYSVQISASDAFGQTTVQEISVTVTPLNDNSPAFSSPTSFQVDENVTAVGTVSATDADQPNQLVTFSITGGADAARFSITSTGVLTFQTAPDFEVPSDLDGNHVYEIEVTAADGSGRTTVQGIAVTIESVNDNSPVFTSSAMFQGYENIVAVGTVSTTDADTPAQTVTYSITGGPDATRFSLTSEGVLTFNTAPDFEAPADADADNLYELLVTADDGAGRTTVQAISVNVAAVNDNAPQFTSPDDYSVPENGTTIGNLGATDADSPSQIVTYFITGGADAALFSITPAGTLQFITAPDFEVPADADGNNVYELQVTANDDSGLTTTQNITVTVTDVGEAPQLVRGGPEVTWIKKHQSISILPQVVAIGNGSLVGGTLTLSMQAVGSIRKSKDLLSIPSMIDLENGSGPTYAGRQLTLQIRLGQNVTSAAIESFLRGITFTTKGKGLKSLTRTVTVTLSNAAGEFSSISQTVHVQKK